MIHVLIVENADLPTRAAIEDRFETAGHEMRCELDPVYKRATWGRRPEDIAAARAVTADLAGRR